MPAKPAKRARDARQGVQGVEIGMHLTLALARQPGPLALGALAKAAGLPPSKTHRYLVSLCRSGVVVQNTLTGEYALGPALIRLGIAAQSQVDEFRLAEEAMTRVHEATQATATVAVWGTHGPTIVRRKESFRPVTVITRIGSVLPMTASAAGRLFAAYLPREVTKPFVDREFTSGLRVTYMGKTLDRRGFERLLGEIRRDGLSRVKGDFLAGVDAIAAPVFNHAGEIAMTLAILGSQGSLDLALAGAPCRAVRRIATDTSARMGNPIDSAERG